jgi:hypothetical protein
MAKHRYTCCICGETHIGYGNNPEPVAKEGSCCDRCNAEKVIPARLAALEAKTARRRRP